MSVSAKPEAEHVLHVVGHEVALAGRAVVGHDVEVDADAGLVVAVVDAVAPAAALDDVSARTGHQQVAPAAAALAPAPSPAHEAPRPRAADQEVAFWGTAVEHRGQLGLRAQPVDATRRR